jgi:hypothetical protein
VLRVLRCHAFLACAREAAAVVSELRLSLPAETVDELVELAVERVLERLAEDAASPEPAEYLTTAEYARRHRTTPGAVLARIHRGTLRAIRPPGAREWLIPVKGDG